MEKFNTLEIIQTSPDLSVFHVRLNRPSSRNALSLDSFVKLPIALSSLDRNHNALVVVVLSGAGDNFCSGIDLAALGSISSRSLSDADHSHAGERLRREIKSMQDAITAIELCRKPVIVAIHGVCVGGGVDVGIVTACDVRYCMGDAFSSVKEVNLAITADLGTLQRLPSIVGYGNAMELALTGRRVSGSEAKEMGLVSRVFGLKRELDDRVRLVTEG